MRPRRVLVAFLAVALASLAVGWRIAASQGAARPKPVAGSTARAAHPRLMLSRELEALARELNRVPTPELPRAPGSGPGVCLVAGSCSLTPCILDIEDQEPRAPGMPSRSTALPVRSVPDEVPISGCPPLRPPVVRSDQIGRLVRKEP